MQLHDFLQIQRQFYAVHPKYETSKGENGLFTCDITLKRLVMVRTGEQHIKTSRISTTKLSAKQFAAEDMLAILKKELHYKNTTHVLPVTSKRPTTDLYQSPKKRSRQAETSSMLQCLNSSWELHVPEPANSSDVF